MGIWKSFFHGRKKRSFMFLAILLCFCNLQSIGVYDTGCVIQAFAQDTEYANTPLSSTTVPLDKNTSASIVKLAVATDDKNTTEASVEPQTSVEITATSCVLMEASTGTILFEKSKDASLPPASITKIMTLLLIFEALEKGKFTLEDKVSVSEHAASMGGSQVFLEPNETQTVETMIKCITICSANDACVAMSEFVAGSEEAFVQKMNEKAAELGMKQTTFLNCCGLDIEGHLSSANDVALMSRELITKYPAIKNYSTIWMDTIIHTTKRGESEFGLSNTNKLLKQYSGITGLKTGSTSKAKYCLSATAERDGLELIAVVMAAPDTKTRFSEAAKLLNYGYATCRLYEDLHEDFTTKWLEVQKGKTDRVEVAPEKAFQYLCRNKEESASITKQVQLLEQIEAPVCIGDTLGQITYYLNGKEVGSIPIVATEEVAKASYGDYFQKLTKIFFVKHKNLADTASQ